MTRIGALPQSRIIRSQENNVAVIRINLDLFPIPAAVGITSNVKAQVGLPPGLSAIRGIEYSSVRPRVFPDIRINIIRILRIDRKAQHPDFLLLRPVSRSPRAVADEIKKLR